MMEGGIQVWYIVRTFCKCHNIFPAQQLKYYLKKREIIDCIPGGFTCTF
jgi:hypothetical protein